MQSQEGGRGGGGARAPKPTKFIYFHTTHKHITILILSMCDISILSPVFYTLFFSHIPHPHDVWVRSMCLYIYIYIRLLSIQNYNKNCIICEHRVNWLDRADTDKMYMRKAVCTHTYDVPCAHTDNNGLRICKLVKKSRGWVTNEFEANSKFRHFHCRTFATPIIHTDICVYRDIHM